MLSHVHLFLLQFFSFTYFSVPYVIRLSIPSCMHGDVVINKQLWVQVITKAFLMCVEQPYTLGAMKQFWDHKVYVSQNTFHGYLPIHKNCQPSNLARYPFMKMQTSKDIFPRLFSNAVALYYFYFQRNPMRSVCSLQEFWLRKVILILCIISPSCSLDCRRTGGDKGNFCQCIFLLFLFPIPLLWLISFISGLINEVHCIYFSWYLIHLSKVLRTDLKWKRNKTQPLKNKIKMM